MAVPVNFLMLYVMTLERERKLRREGSASSAGSGSALSGLSELDETLALSPMLVGGVEEADCALEGSSTVIALSRELEGDARVSSAGTDDRGVAPILSRRAENIVVEKEC